MRRIKRPGKKHCGVNGNASSQDQHCNGHPIDSVFDRHVNFHVAQPEDVDAKATSDFVQGSVYQNDVENLAKERTEK